MVKGLYRQVDGNVLTSHLTNVSNPHQVTAAQVGAMTTANTDGTSIVGNGIDIPIGIINKADGKSYVNVDGAWVEITIRQEKTLLTSGTITRSARLEIDLSSYTGYSQFMFKPKKVTGWNSTTSAVQAVSAYITVYNSILGAWYTASKYYDLGWTKDSENSPYFTASPHNGAAAWNVIFARNNSKETNVEEPSDTTMEMMITGFNSITELPLFRINTFPISDNRGATYGVYTYEACGVIAGIAVGDINAIKIAIATAQADYLMSFDWELWGIV